MSALSGLTKRHASENGQALGVNWKWVKKQPNPKTNIKGPVESLENYKSRPLLKNSQSLAPWKQTI